MHKEENGMKNKFLKALSILTLAATMLVGFNLAAEAEEEIIYVSVDGKSSNEGTKESPKSLNNALANSGLSLAIIHAVLP